MYTCTTLHDNNFIYYIPVSVCNFSDMNMVTTSHVHLFKTLHVYVYNFEVPAYNFTFPAYNFICTCLQLYMYLQVYNFIIMCTCLQLNMHLFTTLRYLLITLHVPVYNFEVPAYNFTCTCLQLSMYLYNFTCT